MSERFPFTLMITQTKEKTMTNVEKLLMKRMKKIDSKVNYKTFHLDPLKEVEKSKHLKGGSDEGTTYEEALVEMGYTLSEETK